MPNANNAMTLATTTPRAESLSPPGWLAAWAPDQNPPVPVEVISAEVDRMVAALEPVHPMALATYAESALSLFPKPENWKTSSSIYLDALADLPDDLARVAFERVARNCRFWPRPAEVREQISVELMERRVAARRLKVALAKAKREVADEARRQRQGAAMNAPPVADRHPITVRVNKLTDLPSDDVEVSPADAAARVAEWESALGRTA